MEAIPCLSDRNGVTDGRGVLAETIENEVFLTRAASATASEIIHHTV